MTCPLCKGEMKPSTTIHTVQLKNCVVVIKNVPCLKCEQCGEIVKAAQQRASEITSAAQTEARTLRQTVTDYCENMLRTTEDTMVENAAQVKNIRNSLRQNAKKNG